MARIMWQSSGLTWDEVCRRAGARRLWNERRRRAAHQRQHEVLNLLLTWGQFRGVQALIAQRLQVSEMTVSRDVTALREAGLW
jgi:DNA-binding CsgD family transcriptional regulator